MTTASTISSSAPLSLQGYEPNRDAGDCTFDEAAAEHPVEFMLKYLTHVKGPKAGEPFKLEPWEAWFVRNLFGWKRPNGYRRYREGFIFVPRGNGKSTLAAAIQVYVTCCDREAGAENYCAAAEAGQARLVFDVAKLMIRGNAELRSRLRIFQHSIALVERGTAFKPLSSVPLSKAGFNVHCAVIDELHAQKDRMLVDMIRTGMGKRLQPLCVHITTSDYDRPSICNEIYSYASKVRDGIIDDQAFLPLIYEADRDADWTSPKVWAKANPNLGVSIPLEYMERECAKAQAEPAYENTFKRYHLNVRTEQADRLIPMDQWDKCVGEPVDPSEPTVDLKQWLSPTFSGESLFVEDDLVGRPCWAGLDLATRTDLNAFVLVWPNEDDNPTYDVRAWFWAPAEMADRRRKRDRLPYMDWAHAGWIKLTPGDTADHRVVREDIVELCTRYQVQNVGFDPFNAAKIVVELTEEDGVPMTQVRQGMLSLGPPTKELIALVAAGRLRQGGNPVLRWMASNVAGRTDHAENVMPDRRKSSEKIDGIVALVMALGLAITTPAGSTRSKYNDDGNDLMVF